MIRALRDLAWLAVLITAGAEFGVLFGHVVYVWGTSWAFAYTGASLFVGFGLVNRLLLHTVIRVVGPVGLFAVFIASIVVGDVALPFVIGWRVSTVFHHLFLIVVRLGRSRSDIANVKALVG